MGDKKLVNVQVDRVDECIHVTSNGRRWELTPEQAESLAVLLIRAVREGQE
jgi:hypothetical protein